MPVFVDESTLARDKRTQPSFAPPLPRVSPNPPAPIGRAGDEAEKFEAVVVGAGPAGLLLTLLLARYGLSDTSVLCIDSKSGTLQSGQADGLQPRTLEVFKSLGLADEILEHGCQMWEVGFWNVAAAGEGISRTAYAEDVVVPARFPHEVTIHQGRLERILMEDLYKYGKRGVQFDTLVDQIYIDEEGDSDYPVVIKTRLKNEYEAREAPTTGVGRTIRAKYAIGCDGAHSVVRRSMGIELQGDSRDIIWGVVDLIVDTNFPDIRRRCAIHSKCGSIMIIPREQIPSGDYLTRLYVQVDEEDESADVASDTKEAMRKKRANITLDGLLTQAQRVFSPYKIQLKQGTEVDWWAAYQIGQRIADNFAIKDASGKPRVFIAGDACHTHSPKAGQGMNVSMMDAYNLSWKLAYEILGLTTSGIELLDSYETERKEIARELINFDTQFSSMFSGKIGPAKEGEQVGVSLTHEQFLEVFSTGSGFTSGCGIQYPQGKLVQKSAENNEHPTSNQDLLNGKLCAGRRLINTRVIRHADGNPRNLQDDFLSTGRFRVLLLCSTDVLSPSGASAVAVGGLAKILESYTAALLEITILHPIPNLRGCSWTDLPEQIKRHAEMRFHSGLGSESPVGKEKLGTNARNSDDTYDILGIPKEEGAICIVRPDGYLGIVTPLMDVQGIAKYLQTWLTRT